MQKYIFTKFYTISVEKAYSLIAHNGLIQPDNYLVRYSTYLSETMYISIVLVVSIISQPNLISHISL